MSASHEWKEWHLTPHGWVSGSEKWDFGKPQIVPPPIDRVLTRRYVDHQSSSFSRVDYYFQDLWQGDDSDGLLVEHGAHPNDGYGDYKFSS